MHKGFPRDWYTNPSGRFTPLEYWMSLPSFTSRKESLRPFSWNKIVCILNVCLDMFEAFSFKLCIRVMVDLFLSVYMKQAAGWIAFWIQRWIKMGEELLKIVFWLTYVSRNFCYRLFVFVDVCECVYICLLVRDGLRWRMICREGCSNPLHQTCSCLVGLESNEQLSPTIKKRRGRSPVFSVWH